MKNGDQGWVRINRKRYRALLVSVQGELADVIIIVPRWHKARPQGGKTHTVVKLKDFRPWKSPGTGWKHGPCRAGQPKVAPNAEV